MIFFFLVSDDYFNIPFKIALRIPRRDREKFDEHEQRLSVTNCWKLADRVD